MRNNSIVMLFVEEKGQTVSGRDLPCHGPWGPPGGHIKPKWIAARVHIGTAKGAKSVLYRLARGQHQRKPARVGEPCAQLEFQWLADHNWSPVATNTLTGGSSYFSDPQWTNYPTHFYRLGATTFGGRPMALWALPNPLILNSGLRFGPQTNAFGFIISWATNIPVVVEVCTNLANAAWSPVATNTLTGGSSYFSDPQWMNHTHRFYRLRSP
jgi:hypothetical protein